jgi:hypothetical protein
MASNSQISTNSQKSLANASLSSASSLIGLQLVSRLLTTVLNSALVRMVSPSVFGTAAIQFEFLLGTILFLSREGVRNALLRANNKSSAYQKSQNISFLPFIVGLPLAVTCAFAFIQYASQDARNQPYFDHAIGVYALAALLELLTEPFHNKYRSPLLAPLQ